MSETCKTVKIKADSESGYSILNESDFDPKVHTLFSAKKAPAKKANK